MLLLGNYDYHNDVITDDNESVLFEDIKKITQT